MKILLVTAHFPTYDVKNCKGRTTPFLQQYAREWVSLGNDVMIIHLMRCYPKLFYILSNVADRLGNKELEKYAASKEELRGNQYIYEGVPIKRIIFKKYIPHYVTSINQIQMIQKELIQTVDIMNPDIIIGDCFDPVLQIISRIKVNHNFSYFQIVHNTDFSLIDDVHIRKAIESVDGWLLRSNAQRVLLDKAIGRSYKYEYMYSGIEDYRVNRNHSPRRVIEKLLFVGTLQKSKGLDTVLEALCKTNNKYLSLSVVGSGIDEDYFTNRVKKLNIEDRVSFEGVQPHDKVFEYMNNSDALVLISHETFGMVYVEAMSQGCIPIGAKNEGIDGVVVNGENGFLTTLNDFNELSILFDSFILMPEEKVEAISHRCINTAKKMTHEKLAYELLNHLVNF